MGSNQPFSGRLNELQEEIRPLYKLTTCSYKRTSVQTIFETAGFKIDWCAFRIVDGGTNSAAAATNNHHHQASASADTISTSSSNPSPLDNSSPDHQHHVPDQVVAIRNAERWEPLYRAEAPQRNYIDELALVIAVPGLVLTSFVALLAIVLCFYHEKM